MNESCNAFLYHKEFALCVSNTFEFDVGPLGPIEREKDVLLIS